MPGYRVGFLLAGALWAAGPQRLPSGLELQLPTGWELTVSGGGAVITPPGHDANAELYFTGIADDLETLDDSALLGRLVGQYFPNLKPTPAGPPTRFAAGTGRGYLHTYDARAEGVPVKINLYLLTLPGHGVATLAALGKAELIQSRAAGLASLAASFRFREAPATTAGPRTNNAWTQRLNDKKLVQFSGYSSGGNSGGMNSQKTLALAADGTYAFRSDSSVSLDVPGASGSSSGRQTDQGRWRVVEQGAEAWLELTSAKNGVERIKLTLQGTQTFLNGRRWLVAGINE